MLRGRVQHRRNTGEGISRFHNINFPAPDRLAYIGWVWNVQLRTRTCSCCRLGVTESQHKWGWCGNLPQSLTNMSPSSTSPQPIYTYDINCWKPLLCNRLPNPSKSFHYEKKKAGLLRTWCPQCRTSGKTWHNDHSWVIIYFAFGKWCWSFDCRLSEEGDWIWPPK